MSAINNYYVFGDFAFASYAGLYKGITGDEYRKALMRDGKSMSSTQAKDFAASYMVVDQYNQFGLSVTIFQDSAGNQTVAIRGSNDILDFLTDAIDIAILGSTMVQTQYSLLSSKVRQWLNDGVLNSGFSVTGHSLGGFLSQALAAEFSSDISATYTFNAPGFAVLPGVPNFETEFLDKFGLIDSSVPIDKIVNIEASAGISVTAGL